MISSKGQKIMYCYKVTCVAFSLLFRIYVFKNLMLITAKPLVSIMQIRLINADVNIFDYKGVIFVSNNISNLFV